MGSKGRLPPSHFRRPLPGPGLLHPDPFGPGIRPPLGSFPYEMMPPPEVLEQRFGMQQVEMERLATENGRLAATHSSLRQELAASQQELQRLQSHMGALKAEQEQQMRVIFDKMAQMEADLRASEPIKLELQQARAEAQSLMSGRLELISKVQHVTQDLQRSHGDAHQIPALMSELENLRQEYQHCRATYDYERKLRIDHYESLQVMEKNYVSMVTEVETLRTELTNLDRSVNAGAPYSSNAGYKENDVSGHQSVGQNAYEDGYGVPQGRGASGQYGSGGPSGGGGRAGYDAARGGAYDAPPPRNSSYDAQRAASYEAPPPRGGGGGSGYDVVPPPSRGAGNSAAAQYGSQAPPPNYGQASGPNYGPGGAQAPPPNYGSATQAPHNYGQAAAQAPQSYGSAAHASSPYGTAGTPTRAAQPPAAGGYEGGPRGAGSNAPVRR